MIRIANKLLHPPEKRRESKRVQDTLTEEIWLGIQRKMKEIMHGSVI